MTRPIRRPERTELSQERRTNRHQHQNQLQPNHTFNIRSKSLLLQQPAREDELATSLLEEGCEDMQPQEIEEEIRQAPNLTHS